MGQGFAREIRRSGFGLRDHAKKEGTGPTTKASEMKIGERGRKGEGRTKKAGTEGSEGTREKCVGIEPCGRSAGSGSRNIALRKCAHTYERDNTRTRITGTRGGGANETDARIRTTFRGHGEFQKESRAR